MQFVKQKNGYKCLAYTGYSKETKRAVVQQVGVVDDDYRNFQSNEAFAALSVEKRVTVESEIAHMAFKHAEKKQEERLKGSAVDAIEAGRVFLKALTDGVVTVTPEQAAQIVEQYKAIRSLLKKSGALPKSEPTGAAQGQPDSKTLPLEGLDEPNAAK